MTYRIELTKMAARQLMALSKPVLRKIDARILALAEDPLPPGVKKLRDGGGLYRIRVGDYRILYQIHQDVLTILVVRVGHRREVYR